MSLRAKVLLQCLALLLVGFVGRKARGQAIPPTPAASAAPARRAAPVTPAVPSERRGSAAGSSAESLQAIPPFDAIKNQQDLDNVVMRLDKELFDAYNGCDLEKFKSMLAEDVEFYHDQGGITLGKDALTESIKKNICSTDTHRELVPGTFEAHYMKGIGAIEIGTHQFLHPKSGNGTGEGHRLLGGPRP